MFTYKKKMKKIKKTLLKDPIGKGNRWQRRGTTMMKEADRKKGQ